MDAIKKNCDLIKDTSYTEFTRIRFVKSKEEMLLHADLYVNALANIYARSIHMVVTDKGTENEKRINPPIVHELMHIVSMTEWGIPPTNVNWLNEGLATYAENNCSGYSVSEIYRYFLEEELLIPIDSLTNHFYQTEEMIGYHQSAYIVEYLISNYGIPKLETLWKSGFSAFESIYELSYSQMEKELSEQILKLYPVSPTIDWETLKEEGCK